MKIDPVNLDNKEAHHLLVGAVVPRPVAWVSTVGEDGIFNLAPFSFFAAMSVKPAIVGFGVGRKRHGEEKDTLRNIEATKEFVINVVDEALAEPMNVTAVPCPADVDEFKEAGLTPVDADLVKVPMVAESPINLECRLTQILEFDDSPARTSFIIGEVLRFHVKDELYVNGEIQMSKLMAVARLGGELYCRTGEIFEMKMHPDTYSGMGKYGGV